MDKLQKKAPYFSDFLYVSCTSDNTGRFKSMKLLNADTNRNDGLPLQDPGCHRVIYTKVYRVNTTTFFMIGCGTPQSFKIDNDVDAQHQILLQLESFSGLLGYWDSGSVAFFTTSNETAEHLKQFLKTATARHGSLLAENDCLELTLT